MMTGERQAFIGSHVTNEVKAWFRIKAVSNGMSISEYVYHVLRKHMTQEKLREQPPNENTGS